MNKELKSKAASVLFFFVIVISCSFIFSVETYAEETYHIRLIADVYNFDGDVIYSEVLDEKDINQSDEKKYYCYYPVTICNGRYYNGNTSTLLIGEFDSAESLYPYMLCFQSPTESKDFRIKYTMQPICMTWNNVYISLTEEEINSKYGSVERFLGKVDASDTFEGNQYYSYETNTHNLKYGESYTINPKAKVGYKIYSGDTEGISLAYPTISNDKLNQELNGEISEEYHGFYNGGGTSSNDDPYTVWVKEKNPQLIQGTYTYKKTIGDKSFFLDSKATTALSYSSSNKKVAIVNSKGKVTIKGTGTTTITVNAQETEKYKKATKKITVKVGKLKSTTLSSVKKSGSKKLKVTWKKYADADGYEVQFATKKNFSKSATKSLRVKKAKTTTLTIKKLKSKRTYYVRVRTYKKVNGKIYFSNWTKVKSQKTR